MTRGGYDDKDPPLPVLYTRAASSFAGKTVPERPWLVRDLIPDRTVTMLAGDGGVGKSLLAKQLGVAVACGTDWVGTLPDAGPVVYVSAEDDEDEVHRRLADIVAAQSMQLADLNSFHLVPLAGRDAVMATPDGRSDLIVATPLWLAIVAEVTAIRPRLLVIDNLADAFAGNENSRPQARQFVGLLRGLAIAFDMAVLLISHPSLTGLSSGSGTSGSTAWSNSVRSRLYFDRARAEDGAEPDPDLRVLRVMKANYSAMGAEVRLRWDAGRFRLDGHSGASAFDRVAAVQRTEQMFLTLLGRLQAQGRDVSHKRSPSYAPALFAKEPDNGSISKRAFEGAMTALLQAEKIKVEAFGPPSRRYSRIVLNEPSN